MTLTLIMASLLNYIQLLYSAARWTIRDIHACKIQRPRAVGAGPGVELCSMVGEGERVSAKKGIEPQPCGIELQRSLPKLALRHQNFR
jgi:hypothetical protein